MLALTKDWLRITLGRKCPFLKQLYFSALAFVKLPLGGTIDYLSALWTRAPDTGAPFTIRLPNHILLRLRRNGTDLKIFQQIFLLEDCRVAARGFSPGIIIDGGAHIGCVSVYYALKYPGARILAIEAAPSNLEQLRQNLKSLPNVEILHAAIFDKAGFVRLENPNADAWEFRVQPLSAAAGQRLSLIPSVTMDNLIERFKGQTVDLVKLDIEGAEVEVFSNSSLGWLNSVRMINIELHDRVRPGCSQAFESAVAGYRAETHRTIHNVVWTNLEA